VLELNWSYGVLPVGSLSPFCLIASLTCLVSACPRIRCSNLLSSLLSRFDSIRFDRGLTSLSRRYPDSSSLEFSPSPFLSLSTTSYHPTWRLCEVFFPTTYLLTLSTRRANVIFRRTTHYLLDGLDFSTRLSLPHTSSILRRYYSRGLRSSPLSRPSNLRVPCRSTAISRPILPFVLSFVPTAAWTLLCAEHTGMIDGNGCRLFDFTFPFELDTHLRICQLRRHGYEKEKRVLLLHAPCDFPLSINSGTSVRPLCQFVGRPPVSYLLERLRLN